MSATTAPVLTCRDCGDPGPASRFTGRRCNTCTNRRKRAATPRHLRRTRNERRRNQAMWHAFTTLRDRHRDEYDQLVAAHLDGAR